MAQKEEKRGRVVITGGAGFVGLRCAADALQTGCVLARTAVAEPACSLPLTLDLAQTDRRLAQHIVQHHPELGEVVLFDVKHPNVNLPKGVRVQLGDLADARDVQHALGGATLVFHIGAYGELLSELSMLPVGSPGRCSTLQRAAANGGTRKARAPGARRLPSSVTAMGGRKADALKRANGDAPRRHGRVRAHVRAQDPPGQRGRNAGASSSGCSRSNQIVCTKNRSVPAKGGHCRICCARRRGGMHAERD